MANSSPITSNQTGINQDLLRYVAKYARNDFTKPIAEHTEIAFAKVNARVQESAQPVILDSGCGTGESSFRLASQFPNQLVVGVDKSAARLDKSPIKTDRNSETDKNVVLVRAELIDIWRLMKAYNWQIDAHFIFYPNPWPKQRHLKRRWHGHPAFLSMLQLSRYLEVRTNWDLYALELTTAVRHLIKLGLIKGNVSMLDFETKEPISRFEKKYLSSGHRLYQIKFNAELIFHERADTSSQ